MDAAPTGLHRPAGSMIFRRDGAAAYLAASDNGSQWINLLSLYLVSGLAGVSSYLPAVGYREALRRSGTFGTACDVFDTPSLACDTNKQPFLVVFDAISLAAGGAGTFGFRVNGSTANLSRSGHYGQKAGNPNHAAAADTAAANYAAGSILTMFIECQAPARHAPRRLNVGTLTQTALPGTLQWTDWVASYEGNDEIDTVGCFTSVANDMSLASEYLSLRL